MLCDLVMDYITHLLMRSNYFWEAVKLITLQLLKRRILKREWAVPLIDFTILHDQHEKFLYRIPQNNFTIQLQTLCRT